VIISYSGFGGEVEAWLRALDRCSFTAATHSSHRSRAPKWPAPLNTSKNRCQHRETSST